MKKSLASLIIMFSIFQTLFAQTINIHTDDGEIHKFKLIEIDSITFSISSDTTIPTLGLIAYYPFNGNANDESGYGHNGIVNGATLTMDRFEKINSAYYFDGLDDYIQITPIVTGLEYATWSVWIKTDSIIGQSGQAIINTWTGAYGTGWLIFLRYHNSKIILETPNNVFYESATPLEIKKWYHVLITADNEKVKIYLNGEKDIEQTQKMPIDNSGTISRIGDLYHPNQWNFIGTIDDVRIYDRILTENEIQSLYHERTKN